MAWIRCLLWPYMHHMGLIPIIIRLRFICWVWIALELCFWPRWPWHSACLFQCFQPKKPIWLSIKRNFLEKVVFWAKAENTQAIMELWRSILEKVHVRSQLSVGLFEQLSNYPSINHVNFLSSHTYLSFLSSHLSALPFALNSLTPLISSLCSAISMLLQASLW